MEWSILGSLRAGVAVHCSSAGRVRYGGGTLPQLEVRMTNSALHCSCTTVTSSIPVDTAWWGHFKCLVGDPEL